MQWLHAMRLLPKGGLGSTFAALCPEFSKGVMLCDLVVAIEGVPVIGVFRRPLNSKTSEARPGHSFPLHCLLIA
jgi:hypothetical protein